MSIEIKAPSFPESVSEGEIATWHVAAGDAVSAGDVVVEIETDKVVMEVQATEDGVIADISKEEGDTVLSEEVIGHITAGAAAAPKAAAEKTDSAKSGPDAEASHSREGGNPASNPDQTPAVRRLLAENNLDAAQIKGTGKDGRLTAEDVKLFLDSRLRGNDSAAKSSSSQSPAPSISGARTEERVKMNRLRKTVAKRLLDVQHGSALLTTFNEVDMYEVMELRKKYKDKFEKGHGTRLGFMSFFTKACVAALKKFPAVNASIDGEDIVYHGYFDIGIAVGSERGLVVPVLRDADQKSMADIEKQIRDFGVRARDGKIGIEEMQGGTFTITNGGTFGSMLSTPIINAPQSGILGMHNIVERPHVVNGEIKIRPIMYLALTYDHRIIDGRESVQFLYTIKEMLEDPARLILDI